MMKVAAITTSSAKRQREKSQRSTLLKSRTAMLLQFVVLMTIGSVGCDADNHRAAGNTELATASDSGSNRAQVNTDATEDKMKITIGSKTFKATLDDNTTVAKLKRLMPLRLNMTDLNGNEKYYHLSTRLPTNVITPGTIQSGDVMLYGDNSLVLFYKTFTTTYSYTRLGRIDDPAGLAAAIGKGDIPVAFELDE